MTLQIANGHIVTADGVLDRAEIAIDRGLIASIAPVTSGRVDWDLDGGWLLPGFIDSQVNGGGGVLFNDDLSVGGIATIAGAHARFGTTALLPTLISDEAAAIAAALDAVDAAIAAETPGVVGVHIEGPFINIARRGIHEARRIRPLDDAMMALLTRPRAGKVMLTLAPELCDPGDIRTLTRHGVIVSAGHSDASYEQARAAIESGVTGFTHLFNAMSPLQHRAPGMVGAALDCPGTWCGLIVDNAHVHPAAVRIAIAAKGHSGIMLVTDAMSSVGTSDEEFTLQGKRILVRDGICTDADGTLAGSALDMATALRNTVAATGLSPVEVAPMAATTTAAFLGLSSSHGALAPGKRADWVWLDAALQPRETWIGGVVAATADE
ncbi:N-acetylglucosamine-6-phosphate deacetylase [Sphingomonas koreensis]|nr:N-acetylglucosamine-6-phosphate deacetylase [Sphingomonas koreensis]